MKQVENFNEEWRKLPLGLVLEWVAQRKEEMWVQYAAGGNSAEWERAESVHNSLLRVLAWLGQLPPPGGLPEAVGQVAEVEKEKAPEKRRGRKCVMCGVGSRSVSGMLVVCQVQMPGVVMHPKCFESLTNGEA